MPQNIVEQIIKKHLAFGSMKSGSEIGLVIDHTLLTDTTGPMGLLQFEAMGKPRIRNKRSVLYADHNTLQLGFENMDDHRFMASAAANYGMHFSRPGNGICHQVNLERFSMPGQTLLGGDSHTTTGGGVGMLAIGAGGMDIAAAMAGEPFYLNMPQVIGVELTGSLPDWCSAKDVCLELLRRLTVSGGRGKVLEFHGPGVKTLSVPERATITNMSIETGAFTAIFPSDEMTREFFRAQEREQDWREMQAEPGAGYDEYMHLNLADIAPLVAKPHLPDKVVTVASLEGLKLDQVAIGSCTNSSLADMMKVAAILEGRKIPPDLSLVIAPGSRQVLLELSSRGLLTDMIAAGARVVENACGFCVGVGQAPNSGGVSLRTINRNFVGRSATKDAQVYLAGAETAAASALTGRLTDPRQLGAPVRVSLPQSFIIDDSLVNVPPESGDDVEIVRGPNIKPLPDFSPMPDELNGPVLLSLGDNITTDDILPAGAHMLSLRSNVPKAAEYVFSRMEPNLYRRALDAGVSFIVAGENYGQGSAREHAALCPSYLGIRVIIADSFARIHKANLLNFGIMPLEFADAEQRGKIKPGDRLSISGIRQALQNGEAPKVQSVSSGSSIEVRLDLSPRLIEVLLAGGMLSYLNASP
jgi:aconitate hydratase